MAHTKAGGSARQKANRRGKRLGVKVFGDQKIKKGGIVVRQRGTVFHAGQGTKLGRDHTLFALKEGIVKFIQRKSKQFISVV